MLEGGGAQNLHDLWLLHVRRHCLLGQLDEVLFVHKLLELGHFVQLDTNGLFLMLVLLSEDILIDALRLQ